MAVRRGALMAATDDVVRIQLINPGTENLYGSDPDTFAENQTALLAPGVTVRVFLPSRGTPRDYTFSWYVSRPDIRWEFKGTYAAAWEAAAKQRASEAADILAATTNKTPQTAANGQWWPTSGTQS
jgi:hypothetical protein